MKVIINILQIFTQLDVIAFDYKTVIARTASFIVVITSYYHYKQCFIKYTKQKRTFPVFAYVIELNVDKHFLISTKTT